MALRRVLLRPGAHMNSCGPARKTGRRSATRPFTGAGIARGLMRLRCRRRELRTAHQGASALPSLEHHIPCFATATQVKLEASLRKCACPSKDALSGVHMAARPFLCHQRAWRPLLWRRRRLPSTPTASLPIAGCAGVWVDHLAAWGPPGDGTGPRGSRLVCPALTSSVVAVRMSGAPVGAQPGGPNLLYVWTGEAVLGASG